VLASGFDLLEEVGLGVGVVELEGRMAVVAWVLVEVVVLERR